MFLLLPGDNRPEKIPFLFGGCLYEAGAESQGPGPAAYGASFLRKGKGGGHFPLDHRGTLDGVDNARELNQRTIAHQLDDPAVELFYGGIDHLPAAGLQPGQRAALVLSHEPAIADHISGENRGSVSATRSPTPWPYFQVRR